MGIASRIEWTDATWNPWQGCTKVSPACANCYMFADKKRYGQDPTVVVRSKPETFRLPMRKRQNGQSIILPGSKVFTCSWSDFFHEKADAWRGEAWDIIAQRPDLIFQIVTKRTGRIRDCLPPGWGNGWPNVWLIATVENQAYAEVRIPELLRVPAAIHGLSIEPLLGPIDLRQFTREALAWLDWIIVGGESGPGARPMHPQWVRSLCSQCVELDIALFFKQWGDWIPKLQTSLACPKEWGTLDAGGDFSPLATPWNGHDDDGLNDPPEVVVYRAGKKAAGRLLDGQEWSEFPVRRTALSAV